MPRPRASGSTNTAATHGVNCGRSLRSDAITDTVPRNASPSWATSANGIGVVFMFSRKSPVMWSSGVPFGSHHARQIRIATVSKNSGRRRRSEMVKARDIDLRPAPARDMLAQSWRKPMTEQPLTKKTVDVLDSRMAYHERGEGTPVLLLHGNPTSSYLWRDVIPGLEGRGRRVAPDLIGMGDSAKLPNPGPDTYRFTTHRQFVGGFIDAVISP